MPPSRALLGVGMVDRPRQAHDPVDIVAIITPDLLGNGFIDGFHVFKFDVLTVALIAQ